MWRNAHQEIRADGATLPARHLARALTELSRNVYGFGYEKCRCASKRAKRANLQQYFFTQAFTRWAPPAVQNAISLPIFPMSALYSNQRPI